jgi:hypothetical protein
VGLRLSALSPLITHCLTFPNRALLGSEEISPSLRILRVLAEPPSLPLSPSAAQRVLFASILFSSLIRSSERCKSVAQSIIPSHLNSVPPPSEDDDDDDPPQSLLATLVGSIALALRSRSQAREQGATVELGEWDRVVVAYLSILCLWCWDNPRGVKEVLVEGGALGVVSLVPSLVLVSEMLNRFL